MSNIHVYCGVDVSKNTLDAFCLGVHRQFHQTANGWAKLLAWLDKLSPDASIVCEASGGYERAAIDAFKRAGRRTYVVAPLRVRQFAASMGRLAKTDKIDAEIIAAYAEIAPLKEPCSTSLEQQRLVALVNFAQQIKLKIVDLENQARLLSDPEICSSAKRLLKQYAKELERIDAAIDALLKNSPDLSHKVKKLMAFQGIGRITALTLISQMPELGSLSKREVASLAGLAPFNRDSGSLKGRRSIRGGRPAVRTALYMAALTAAKRNPVLAPLYNRLCNNGKPFKVAIVAVMRKLLIAANASLQNPNFSLVS